MAACAECGMVHAPALGRSCAEWRRLRRECLTTDDPPSVHPVIRELLEENQRLREALGDAYAALHDDRMAERNDVEAAKATRALLCDALLAIGSKEAS